MDEFDKLTPEEVGDLVARLIAGLEPESRGDTFRRVMERAVGQVRGYDGAYEAMLRDVLGTPVLVVVRPIPLPSRN